MTKNEELFHQIAAALPEMSEGKMFGAMCIKAQNGKAGAMFWNEHMIFKLSGDLLVTALQLDGAKLFDPMGGRPMGGWVQLSADHKAKWKHYAELAMEEVKKIEIKEKKKAKK